MSKSKPSDALEPTPTTPQCKHINTRLSGEDLAGTCRCQDCGEVLPLYEAFNILLDAMREAIA
jgi:hypothetical protein